MNRSAASVKYVLGSLSLVLVACGAAPTELPPVDREGIVAAGDSTEGADAGVESADADPCARHATGCPCDQEGQTVECGIVHQQFGDYVRCTPGYRACQNGAWSDCTTDRVVGPN
jgi:hypothetical protein